MPKPRPTRKLVPTLDRRCDRAVGRPKYAAAELQPDRRRLVLAALGGVAAMAWPASPSRAAGEDVEAALRAGGVVLALRHALAPGTFDPPGFRVEQCSTQRNLNDEGRAQARRIGEWFRARSLKPARVRTSPWCRCIDTATLAFGHAEKWAALGSPHGAREATSAEHLAELRRALAEMRSQRGAFEFWSTHNFVLSGLAGSSAGSGEGLVLRAGADGAPEILARLVVA
jgi:Histidine phosphatase superfamily (branch 1)